MNLTELLTSIANAIRDKKGTTASINAQDFPTEIASIPKGSGNAGVGDVLNGKTFSNSDGEQVGAMPNRNAVSQTIAPGGSYTIPAGYHNGRGKVSASTYKTQTISGTVNVPFYNNTTITLTATNLTTIWGVRSLNIKQTHWAFVFGKYNIAGKQNPAIASISGNKITINVTGYVNSQTPTKTEPQTITCEVIGI